MWANFGKENIIRIGSKRSFDRTYIYSWFFYVSSLYFQWNMMVNDEVFDWVDWCKSRICLSYQRFLNTHTHTHKMNYFVELVSIFVLIYNCPRTKFWCTIQTWSNISPCTCTVMIESKIFKQTFHSVIRIAEQRSIRWIVKIKLLTFL